VDQGGIQWQALVKILIKLLVPKEAGNIFNG
jgi:hypothetical protein